MFAQTTRHPGRTSIALVAVIAALWVLGTGLFMKTYREGGMRQVMPDGSTCQLVCGSGPAKG